MVKFVSSRSSSLIRRLSRGPALYPVPAERNRFLIWWMAVLIAARLWIVGAIDVIATHSPYDEELFIKLAAHIINGEWLGPYNQLTLAKGPGLPLFIALTHQLGIPLLTAEQLLYSFACILTVIALRPLFRNQWAPALIFLFLLLNPFMLSYSSLGRIFRLGIYMPFSLCIFGLFIGLLVRGGSSYSKRLGWSALLGIFFSWFWYTREEGIWLLPSLILFAAYFLIIYSDLSLKETLKRTSCLLLVGAIFAGCSYTLAKINEKYYGAPVINELKTPEFGAAMGTLMNIDGLRSGKFVPVSADSQEAAFSASPTFAKLKPYLYPKTHPFSFPTPYYIWIFRDAVKETGNGNSLPEALAFYKAVGQELQAACSTGALNCLDRTPSIRPIWKKHTLAYVPKDFKEIWVQAVTFSHFTDGPDEYLTWGNSAHPEDAEMYRFVTRANLTPGKNFSAKNFSPFYLKMKREKLRLLAQIASVYKTIVPPLFILSLLAHLVLIIRAVTAKTGNFVVINGLIVLGGALSLIVILVYAKSATATWNFDRPLFGVYPLILLYICVMLSLFWKGFREPKSDG